MTKKSNDRQLQQLADALQAVASKQAGEPVAMCVLLWTQDGNYQRYSNVEPIPCANVLRSIADDVTAKAMDRAADLQPLRTAAG